VISSSSPNVRVPKLNDPLCLMISCTLFDLFHHHLFTNSDDILRSQGVCGKSSMKHFGVGFCLTTKVVSATSFV
jgi:hypothetical protein